jgi:hypothetical protein
MDFRMGLESGIQTSCPAGPSLESGLATPQMVFCSSPHPFGPAIQLGDFGQLQREGRTGLSANLMIA